LLEFLVKIKVQEYRVALTPEGVTEFVKNGHTVLIEKSAGLGSSITDENFVQAGAKIVDSVEKFMARSRFSFESERANRGRVFP